ncbi:hypothetical protein AMK27_05355 [Streptomyces sp. CB02009]|uniref:hypothetical protein n=1 Tax=Streptomyces sp. CB02009 TaxID=1703938 RepID=UPI000939409F|nr:hypothetical protein [Streptomyces sp. CB02009]OKJ65235.1 hypothetical protein AMK27_05355 [Streptomyces sp. CB02009]
MHTATRPALVLTTALVLGLGLPQPAAAHGDNLDVVITGHRDGHVLTEVTWENDGDPVDEQVAALVSAVSADGLRTAGPWKLVRGTRPTAWTTAEALPTGVWKVTVAAGQPALGHSERQLTVAAAPSSPSTASTPGGTAATPARTPHSARVTSPAPKASPSPSKTASAAESEDEQTWGPWLTTIGLAVASLAGAAAGIWIRRRRGGRR